MDIEQQRIEEDLRGQIAGDVRCDDLFVQLYSSDASIFELTPLGVIRPRTVDDVVATVRYAAENKISVHARGSGSGLAGESLGRGLILDFSRYMHRVLEVTDHTAQVQAGVVVDHLNARLSKHGRVFGPDPATSHVTTMGGTIAVDGSGSRWPIYGSARQQVESLEVVLANGELVEFSTHDVPTSEANSDKLNRDSLLTGLAKILHRYDNEIKSCQPRSLVNRCGYRLDDLQLNRQLHLARLLAGSEGTLGLITQATVKIVPLAHDMGSVLLFFESLDKAAHAVQELMPLGPSACDLMDRRHLSLARESDPRYELLIPQAAEAVLLIEFQADSAKQVSERLKEAVARLVEKNKLIFGSYIAEDHDDHQMLWQLARHFVPTLYRLKGSTRPIPIVEDIAVPPDTLPDFLPRLQQILRAEEVTASLFGHVGHGQLHIRPFLDLANEADLRKMRSITDQLYETVWEFGGTISGEHADGLSRTPYVAKQYGPLANAFVEIKSLFDPERLFNPGKIVSDSSYTQSGNLRRITYPLLDVLNHPDDGSVTKAKKAPEKIGLQLDWQPEEMAHAARSCNGCASCRTLDETLRMCPIYRFAPREEASPRAKANLARGILTGSLPASTVLEDSCKEVADLCVHCHMCRLECPANVDIPKLMVEAKASYTATNGEPFQDWLMARIDQLCALGSRFARLSNWAIKNRPVRWLLERLLGIAQGRKLPRFSPRPFLLQAAERRLNRPQRVAAEKVLYFVDTYANYCDPELANAFVATLEHNGISTYVPNSQQQAGMPLIARGILEPARKVAEENVALLAEAVRQGYTIVATEPSAVLALTHEYLMLLPGDHDAELVAKHSYEACHYLWRCHQRGQLQLDFSPLNTTIGYHTPCHTKALQVGSPAENLLRLIPGVRVQHLEKGCSGIAGLYGFQRRNYRNSLRAGLPLLTAIRTGEFTVSATECSTCRVQMEQGTTKPTIHPIKLVALAYGLMPELHQLLNSSSEDLVVT